MRERVRTLAVRQIRLERIWTAEGWSRALARDEAQGGAEQSLSLRQLLKGATAWTLAQE